MIALLALLANPGGWAGYTEIVDPCTEDESVEFPKGFPERWESAYEDWADAEKPPLEGLWAAAELRGAAGAREPRAFAEYWSARSLELHGLSHLAWDGYSAVLAAPPVAETQSIRAAAAACLVSLHGRYPGFRFSDALAKGAATLPKAARAQLALRIAEERLSGEPPKSGEDPWLRPLAGAGGHAVLAQAWWAARAGNEDAYIKQAAALGKSGGPVADRRDAFQLALGRAYFGKGRFEEATHAFEEVSNESNHLPDAIVGAAWSALQLGDYSGAADRAQNLMAGALRETFSPEAYLVLAIAQNETCNFGGARDTIAAFRKRFDKLHRWIAYFSPKLRSGQLDAYRVLADHLRGKRRIPSTLAGEWGRSPSFIAAQSTLNAVIDARRATRDAETFMHKKYVNIRKTGVAAAAKETLDRLARGAKALDPAEKAALASARSTLLARLAAMEAGIRETHENLLLVEAEIFNAVSDSALAKGKEVDPRRAPAKAPAVSQGAARGAQWDWGKFEESAEPGGEEIWEDEVGFIKADIEDRCGKE